MQMTLELYIRQRCRQQGISLSDLCRKTGIGRQTLYDLWQKDNYPNLTTLVQLAEALEVHPMQLLALVFQQDEA